MMNKKISLVRRLFLCMLFFVVLSGTVLLFFPKFSETIKSGLPNGEEWKNRFQEIAIHDDLTDFFHSVKSEILSQWEWLTFRSEKEEDRKIPPFLVSCDAFLPCDFQEITSDFGERVNPISLRKEYHRGLDLSAAEGSEIRAGWPGIITECGFDNIYGNYVIITHSDNFKSKYAHLSKIGRNEGSFVKAGEKIGEAGHTGWATGSHLHFEVTIQGQNLDPKAYLPLC